MDALVYSPSWFHGMDIILELASIIIAMALTWLGIHAYRVTDERKHAYFGAAFGLITLGFLGRFFTATTISLNAFHEQLVDPVVNSLGVGWRIFSIGRVLYVFLMLAAYALLLALALKWQRKREFLIISALIAVIASTSIVAGWTFWTASLILLFAIAMQHYINFKETGSALAFNISVAFMFWTLEPFLGALSIFEPSLAVAAYIARLVAYILLLKFLWRIL